MISLQEQSLSLREGLPSLPRVPWAGARVPAWSIPAENMARPWQKWSQEPRLIQATLASTSNTSPFSPHLCCCLSPGKPTSAFPQRAPCPTYPSACRRRLGGISSPLTPLNCPSRGCFCGSRLSGRVTASPESRIQWGFPGLIY